MRGEGRGFCAGRDLADADPANEDGEAILNDSLNPVVERLAGLAVPTFAAVHGAALGTGLGLALACDVVYVADDARIGSPFARIGAVLDSGAHDFLVRRIGAHRTLELVYTGRMLSGREAADWGIVNRSIGRIDLLPRVRQMARAVADGPTLAFLASKRIVRRIADDGLAFADVLRAEAAAQGAASRTRTTRTGSPRSRRSARRASRARDVLRSKPRDEGGLTLTEFAKFALLGLGLGAIYALAAQGIVLVYRGSGVLNFAQGAMAAVGAYVYVAATDADFPTWLAVVAGVLASAAIGVLTQVLIMRPLRDASPLTRLVATLGLLTVLQAALIGWPFNFGDQQRFVTGFLPSGLFAPFKDVSVSVDRIWLLGIAVVLSTVLWAVYKFTRFGLAHAGGRREPGGGRVAGALAGAHRDRQLGGRCGTRGPCGHPRRPHHRALRESGAAPPGAGARGRARRRVHLVPPHPVGRRPHRGHRGGADEQRRLDPRSPEAARVVEVRSLHRHHRGARVPRAGSATARNGPRPDAPPRHRADPLPGDRRRRSRSCGSS